jgi:hypothetical protein
VGPVTERIPQPVPDKENPGHFMDVYETPTTDRTPDDYQPALYKTVTTKDGRMEEILKKIRL